jgi:hypothetical protein
VQRLEPGHLVDLLHQPLAKLVDQPPALAPRQLAPCAPKRRPCRRDRGIDIVFRCRCDFGDHFFSRRVDDRHRLAAGRVTPLAVNEKLFPAQQHSDLSRKSLNHEAHQGHE